MRKVSLIIAAYKEERVVGRALEALVRSARSANISFKIIQVSPDEETLEAGMAVATKLGITDSFQQLIDPLKGKAFALNLALDVADGELVVMTDGDVYVDESAIKELLRPFEYEQIGGTTGQPVPTEDKNTFMGYIANLLTTVAHVKRCKIFSDEKDGYRTGENAYFPLSGYLLAFRNNGFRYAPGYIDDTYISIKIIESGMMLAYSPKALVNVTYPKDLGDYFKQRRRNIEGNRELHYQYTSAVKDERTLKKELEYALFPIRYARTPMQFLWSLSLYPIRLTTWSLAFVDRFKPKERNKPWDQIRSTK